MQIFHDAVKAIMAVMKAMPARELSEVLKIAGNDLKFRMGATTHGVCEEWERLVAAIAIDIDNYFAHGIPDPSEKRA